MQGGAVGRDVFNLPYAFGGASIERVFEGSPYQGPEISTSKLRAFELTLETENFVPPCEEFPAFFAFSGLDETLPG